MRSFFAGRVQGQQPVQQAVHMVGTYPGAPTHYYQRYFGRYPIQEGAKEHYANLFGLLLAIDSVEHGYANGYFERSLYVKLSDDLGKQLDKIMNVLHLDINQVEAFVGATRIRCDYFLNKVKKGKSPQKDGDALNKAMRLGAEWVTLQDWIEMKATSREIKGKLLDMRELFLDLRIMEDPAVSQYYTKWCELLDQVPWNESPSADVLNILREDLPSFNQAAKEAAERVRHVLL